MRLPIVVEGVFELLAGHGRAVVPVTLAGSDLAQCVVGVNPIAAIGQRAPDALVGVVVAVGAQVGQLAGGGRGVLDALQAVQPVVVPAHGQPRRGALLRGDGADQPGVGMVGVGRRIASIAHRLKPTGSVVTVVLVDLRRRVGGHAVAAERAVVAPTDGQAIQHAAGVSFAQRQVGIVVGIGGGHAATAAGGGRQLAAPSVVGVVNGGHDPAVAVTHLGHVAVLVVGGVSLIPYLYWV